MCKTIHLTFLILLKNSKIQQPTTKTHNNMDASSSAQDFQQALAQIDGAIKTLRHMQNLSKAGIEIQESDLRRLEKQVDQLTRQVQIITGIDPSSVRSQSSSSVCHILMSWVRRHIVNMFQF